MLWIYLILIVKSEAFTILAKRAFLGYEKTLLGSHEMMVDLRGIEAVETRTYKAYSLAEAEEECRRRGGCCVRPLYSHKDISEVLSRLDKASI